MDLKILAAQLRKPEGETGHLVGELMNNGNKLINERAIEALDLKEHDAILEIGMGNGYYVKSIFSKQPVLHYTGIDYSPLMVEEAITDNSIFVQTNQANFVLGSADSLPFNDDAFTKILTINTVYFWGDCVKEFNEIKRVLNPNGTLVIAIRTKESMKQMPFTAFGFTKYDRDGLVELVERNGFTNINLIDQNEAHYEHNGQQISLQNFILTCTKQ